jgi:protein-S-isoprenylcysteine O-methyltransferase
MWIFQFLLLQFPLMRLGRWTSPLGYSWGLTGLGTLVTLTGLWIRLRSIYVLHENFSYVVHVGDEHRLVTTGPYRFVRHPAYTGLILYFAGLALVICDLYSLEIFMAYVGVAVTIRIWREEKRLAARFGDEYRAWKKRTKLLIPWVL